MPKCTNNLKYKTSIITTCTENFTPALQSDVTQIIEQSMVTNVTTTVESKCEKYQ